MAIRVRRPLPLTFAQFSPTDYPGLNGPQAFGATKADITRSLLMLGYPSRSAAIATAGPWRAALLSSLIEGYLDTRLLPTDYFLALEPSERVSMTFLIAQAFTHWAADAYMSVPVLIHVASATPHWSLAAMPVTGKAGAGVVKDKGRPDFIGIGHSGYHVFESKGRSLQAGVPAKSDTIAAGCMRDALAQVSRLATVNGKVPRTRTAAVWVLRPGSVRGYITDPPAAGKSYDLTFEVREALLGYYRIILDTAARSSRLGTRLALLPLGDNMAFIVERKLLDLIEQLERPGNKGEELLGFLEARAETYARVRRTRRGPGFSLGLDGIGLMVGRGQA